MLNAFLSFADFCSKYTPSNISFSVAIRVPEPLDQDQAKRV